MNDKTSTIVACDEWKDSRLRVVTRARCTIKNWYKYIRTVIPLYWCNKKLLYWIQFNHKENPI